MIKLEEFSEDKTFEINFSYSQSKNELWLNFTVNGPVQLLYPQELPTIELKQATDLWKKTCFEAFFFNQEGPSYCEVNFNVLGEYCFLFFDDYRIKSTHCLGLDFKIKAIQRELSDKKLKVSALVELPNNPSFLLSPTLILYPNSGETLYYALKHGAKADFHSRQVTENKAFIIR
ncbi:MAG: hypothetical protein R3A80_04995 [Bdellovibrionota bacterium]